MMISTQQKAIIRQICKEQEESLIRLMTEQTKTLFDELQEEGYEVSEADIAEEIARQLILWDAVKRTPEKFTQLVDEANLGIIKHHLVQSYFRHPDSPPLWRHLNLYDRANANSN